MARLEATDARLVWDAPAGVEAVEGGVRPARFPREVTKKVLAFHPGIDTRMECPAGCALRLVTDAARVALSIRVVDVPREYGEFVARSAGLVIGAFRNMDFQLGQSRFEISIDGAGRMREVEILLPHCMDFLVTGVEVEGSIEAAAPTGATGEAAWLAIGDSITQGMNAVSPLSPYPQRIADALGVGVWNLGIGGIRTRTEPFVWALSRRPWRLVTIALGGNDAVAGTPMPGFEGHARALIGAAVAKAPGAGLVVITPTRFVRAGFPPDEVQQRYRDALARVAGEFKSARVVDGLTLVDPEKGHLGKEGIHPTDEGFAAYAEGLLPVVSPFLK